MGLDRDRFVVGKKRGDISGDCIFGHRDCLSARIALGVATWEGWNVDDESTRFFIGFEHDSKGKCVGGHQEINYSRTTFSPLRKPQLPRYEWSPQKKAPTPTLPPST